MLSPDCLVTGKTLMSLELLAALTQRSGDSGALTARSTLACPMR